MSPKRRAVAFRVSVIAGIDARRPLQLLRLDRRDALWGQRAAQNRPEAAKREDHIIGAPSFSPYRSNRHPRNSLQNPTERFYVARVSLD